VTAARVNPYRPNVACTVTTAGLSRNVKVLPKLANPNFSARLANATLVPAEKIPCDNDSRIERPVIPLSRPEAVVENLPVIAPRLSPELKLNDIDLSVIVSRAKANRNGSMLNEIVTPPNFGGKGARVTEPLMLALSHSLPERLIVVLNAVVPVACVAVFVNVKLVPSITDCRFVP